MEKEYYTLTELTERWDFCLHDALYLAENNICRFWINLPESDARLYYVWGFETGG